VSKKALPKLVVIALLIGGAALRLEYVGRAVPFYGPPGMDDLGTVALMSKHIVEGRELPLYFYGQGFTGALGAYVGAVTFLLFGQSFVSLCAAMLPFSVLWILATYLLFRRLGGETAGLAAAALVAFAPPVLMYFSTVPHIGYPPTLAFGTLVLYLGVRLNDADTTARAEWLLLGGLGALAGAAIWTNPLSIPYLVVAFGLVVLRLVRSPSRRRLIPKLALAAALLVATALPAFVTAFRRGFGSMFGLWPADAHFIPDNARLLATEYVPNQLFGQADLPRGVSALAAAAYIVLGAGSVIGLAFGLARKQQWALRAAPLPLALVVVFLAFFLPNSRTTGMSARYFSPFYLGVVASAVFPLAAGRRWLTGAAAVLIAVVIGHNVAAVLSAANGAPARAKAQADAALEERVRCVEATGLRHVMTPRYNGQVMTFLADEKVVFAALTRDCYYPYTVAASADDDTGFMMPDAHAPAFEATLRALGITSLAAFPANGWTVFARFDLPRERLRLVEPTAVYLVGADGSVTAAGGLADDDGDTIVGDEFRAGSSVVFDLGATVRLRAVRFVAPGWADYPVGYTLAGATDAFDGDAASPRWTELQHVEARDPLTCISGNRLYQHGHDTIMECRFPASPVRLLRISGFRPRAHRKVWRFREAYCYVEAGQGGLPDAQEAADIASGLARAGVELAICDEWLSRKIELEPDARPRVLPHWEARHPASHVSRVPPVRRGVAILVESAHAEQAGALLDEVTVGEVSVHRRDFPHYTAFIVEKAPLDYESFPGLRWNGVTLMRTACIATAGWYCRHGERLDDAGDRDGALRCFRRSYETFPGIRANLELLAPHDEEAARMLATLTPAREARVRFPHGVSLVGYTLVPETLMPGQPATLRLVWQLDGRMKHSFMPVFVHFRDEKHRLFQADHDAVFPVEPDASVPPALVLDEFTFTVPDDVPAGELTVYLGATGVADRNVRLKPRTKLPTTSRAVEIGRVTIGR
jgi:hypothetical protein